MLKIVYYKCGYLSIELCIKNFIIDVVYATSALYGILRMASPMQNNFT